MKKLIFPFIIMITIICFLIVGIDNGWLAAGSYSYAQKYKFYVNPAKLRRAIDTLKENNANFKNLNDLEDLYDKNNNFHMYIYCPKENEVIHIYIEPDDNANEANLYLVGFSRGKELGNWKNINRDFDRSENLSRKRKFKEQLLNNLHLVYKDKGNAMFVFWK